MSLSQVVAKYLVSAENHTEVNGENLAELVKTVKNSSMEEIITEYNLISQQKLWIEPLVDTFYTEMLNRLLDQTTFSLTTLWTTIDDWKKNPFGTIQLGLEDSYPLLDQKGNPVRKDDTTVESYTLTNRSFSDEFELEIIRMLLRVPNGVNLLIAITTNGNRGGISIVGIENAVQFHDRILFQKSFPGVEVIRVRSLIREQPDLNANRRVLDGLRKETFEIVDLTSDRNAFQIITDKIQPGDILPDQNVLPNEDEEEDEDEADDS